MMIWGKLWDITWYYGTIQGKTIVVFMIMYDDTKKMMRYYIMLYDNTRQNNNSLFMTMYDAKGKKWDITWYYTTIQGKIIAPLWSCKML